MGAGEIVSVFSVEEEVARGVSSMDSVGASIAA